MSLGLEIIGIQPLGLDAGASSAGSSDPVIVDVTGADTTAVITYTWTATHYRLNSGASVAIGVSPYTITGLAANTEYDIEITADEITWTDIYQFGTDNSATGSGEIPLGEEPPASSPDVMVQAIRSAIVKAIVNNRY